MLDLHAEQTDHVGLVVKGDYDLALPNFDLHDVGLETHICDNSLSFYISCGLLSSKIASLCGGAKGVSLNPTSPIKLDLSMSSHI